MPEQNSTPPIASTIVMFAGFAIVVGALLLTVAFPRLPMVIAIAIGAVLATPLIVLGLRLQPQSTPPDGTLKHFWPKLTEAKDAFWCLVAFVTLFACFVGPVAVLMLVGGWLPSGDTWGIVTLRLVFLVLALLGCMQWIKFVCSRFPTWFRGSLSDETLETIQAIARHEPTAKPRTAIAAATENWQIAVIALVAFCIAFGVIDFDSPWLNIDAWPKRARGLVHLVQWCRGNPNTVKSSAVLVGTSASAFYIFRICSAALTNRANAPQ